MRGPLALLGLAGLLMAAATADEASFNAAMKRGDPAAAERIARAALRNTRNDADRAGLWRAIGTAEIARSDLVAAEVALRESEAFARRAADPRELGATLVERGTLNAFAQRDDQARAAYREGVALLRANAGADRTFQRQMLVGLYSLGSVEVNDGHLDRAAALYAEAVRRADAFGDRNFAANVRIGQAALFGRLNRLDAAEAAARAATAAVDVLKPGYERASAWLALAEVARRRGRFAGADAAIDKAEAAARAVKPEAADALRLALKARAVTAQTRGDLGAAAAAWKAMARYQESHFSAERAKLLADADARFGAREREEQIVRLRQRERIAMLAAERQRAIAIGTAVAVALLMVIAALLWRAVRQRRAERDVADARRAEIAEQARALAAALADREVLLRELEHRVRNNLHVVRSLIDLQTRGADGSVPAEALRDIGARLHTMVQLHDRLAARDAFGAVDMQQFLDEIATHNDELYGAAGDTLVVASEIVLPLHLASPIGLIACELLANAHKHAQLGTGDLLEVRLTLNETEAQLIVADDGVGRPPEAGHAGIGTSLIEALAQAVGGVVDYAPRRAGPRPGLVARVRIPLGAMASRGGPAEVAA